ncbi:MAG: DUF6152 family protein [Gammaproteobacteria bacterium]
MKALRYVVAATTACCALGAYAHHSPFLFFDPSTTIEIEGELTSVQWRNPHVMFEVETADGVPWVVEANAVSILRRMNLTPDTFREGDQVSVAGWPAQRGGNEIFVTNMLMRTGEEIGFMPGVPPRWGDKAEGDTSTWLITENELDTPATADIFHVWSTSLGLGPGAALPFDGVEFPLTPAAAAARADYDIYDSPILEAGCVHKGMPTIMEQPYPMEFIDEGDRIVMRMEEGDAVRLFDMRPDAEINGLAPIPMGHSKGRWEDGDLVVETTGASWPYIDMTGIPNSPDTHYVERFALSENGNRLDYTMIVTDTDIFTEPVTLTKSWLNIPGAKVAPYQCEE